LRCGLFVCIVLLVESQILDARRAQASLVRLSAKWPLPLARLEM
jgi:hypothetical protein